METWKSVGKQYLLAIGSENSKNLYAHSSDLCAWLKAYKNIYSGEHSQYSAAATRKE